MQNSAMVINKIMDNKNPTSKVLIKNFNLKITKELPSDVQNRRGKLKRKSDSKFIQTSAI